MLAVKLGLAAIAVVALRIGRAEARLQHRGGQLPPAQVRPRTAADHLRFAAARASELSHAIAVAVGLASLAGALVGAALLLS